MEATVTHRFYGAPDDAPNEARWHEAGEKVSGKLAESVVAQGMAKAGKSKGPAPKNKAKGAAPENK